MHTYIYLYSNTDLLLARVLKGIVRCIIIIYMDNDLTLIRTFQMVDPGGIANRSITYVDWTERKWHPKAFKAKDISYELLRNLSVRFF